MKVITTTLEGVGSNRKLDATSYINGIEHVENDADGLLKVSGLLKPDRHLLILVPGHSYLHSKFDGTIGHFRRCNKSILQNAVPKDLKKKDVKYIDSFGLLALLANKWFLKQNYPELKQVKFWDNFIISIFKITDVVGFYIIGNNYNWSL